MLGQILRTFFLSTAVLLGIVCTSIAQEAKRAPTIAGADRPGPWGASSYDFSLKVSKSVFKTVNLQRQNRGLRPFIADPSLGLVAGSYAGDMMSGDFFGHFAPDGRDLEERFAEANVIQFEAAAEILWHRRGEIAWQYEEVVRSAVLSWLNSKEGYRESIFEPDFPYAGIGTAIRDERIVIVFLVAQR